jgi:hypothetical protein
MLRKTINKDYVIPKDEGSVKIPTFTYQPLLKGLLLRKGCVVSILLPVVKEFSYQLLKKKNKHHGHQFHQ